MAFLFFTEIVALFFLSRILTRELSYLFYRVFRSRKVSIWLISILFLPGTIIHEFSHALMAKLLFVYVGKMELIPQLNGESLKLGSVEIGKTDIVRNFLIGIAPFISGTIILLILLYSAYANNIFGINIFTLLILLLTFMISNTMYSSKKDMEGAIEFFLLIVAPIIVLYLLGVRFPIPQINLESYFRMGSIFLAVPLVLDIAFISISKIFLRGSR